MADSHSTVRAHERPVKFAGVLPRLKMFIVRRSHLCTGFGPWQVLTIRMEPRLEDDEARGGNLSAARLRANYKDKDRDCPSL